jgi:hypothetical protein
MFRLLVAVSVASACVAHAGKPTFESVLKKFPPAKLPLTMVTPPDAKVTFDNDEKALLKVSGNVHPVAAVQRNGLWLLLVTQGGDSEQQTSLMTFNAQGLLLGSVLFHRDASGSWGRETNVSSINEGGAISRLINGSYPIYGNGFDETMKVAGEARARVTSTGAIEVMPPAWKNRNGRYIDRKTKEELIYDKPVLYYRASVGQPLQRLDGEGNSWRHKDVTRPWLLTWNDLRSELSVENSEGVVQLFTREY